MEKGCLIKVISFYGLRRSGNHAILEWLVHSLGDGESRNEVHTNRIIKYGKAAYLNECNTWEKEKINEFVENSKLDFIILSYEDTRLDFSLYETKEKIVLVRDIINLCASRMRAFRRDLTQDILNIWLEHAEFDNVINYETWLTNKQYRDNFVKKYNKTNLDRINYVSKIGGGSSFVGRKLDKTENLLNRWKKVGFSENTKNLLKTEKVIKARKLINYQSDYHEI